MNKVLKMKPIDQAVLTATEGNDEGIAQPLPPPANDSLAELLRIAHARHEAEALADEKNKAEVDRLIGRLIQINEDKRTMYRAHAEARLERQAHNTAQGQVEADERDALLEEDGKVLFQIRQLLYGKYTQPIFLPRDEQRQSARPRKRSLWRRALGL